MKKIFTTLLMLLTGTAAVITIDGCLQETDRSETLYESDILDAHGVTYQYLESDTARISLDYYVETNKEREVIVLNDETISREYHYDGNRYRVILKYTSQRREVEITIKKIGD